MSTALFSPEDGFRALSSCSISSSQKDQGATKCRISALRMVTIRGVTSRNEVATREHRVADAKHWSFEKVVPEEHAAAMTNGSSTSASVTAGLGIVQSLKHKRILITGATGFLGKVLVEKILRTQPDVGKIYLLINADSPSQAKDRMAKDVQDSTLFQELQRKHGSNFRHFLQEKLVPLPGRIEKEDLGLDPQTRKELSGSLDIIVNSAATTNFTERYDVALDINTKGPLNLLNFAKTCTHIQLFMHISTAFVNGTRKGRVEECPFAFGQSLTKEMLGEEGAPDLNVWKEIESVRNKRNFKAEDMKELGMQRAKLHGWQDTYVFTKAMGEMLVNQERGDIPVVILRPSVVESTISQPFEGWIQGTRMMDPILLAFGRGQIDSFYADPNGVLDVVPADMVANTLLAAMSYHAGRKANLTVYQVGSSVTNPLTFQSLANYAANHFTKEPFRDQNGQPVIVKPVILHTMKLSFAIHCFLNYRLPVELAKFWGSQRLRKHAKVTALMGKRLEQLLTTYSPYTFYEARFDTTNTMHLYEKMTPEEKDEFAFNVWSVDWSDYISNIHLPGLRKHNVRDNSSTLRPINIRAYIQGALGSATA